METDLSPYAVHQQNKKYNNYNYISFLMMLFITLFIVCDITAFRMTKLFGAVAPVSGIIIPFIFSLGDIIADAYGYHISRKLIWNAIVCQFIFGIVITGALLLPNDGKSSDYLYYNLTFQHIIRTNITSCMSVSSGMFTNAFLMSKLKIWMNGKNFWIRTILSSSISEFVLCFVAYTTLYYKFKTFEEIWFIILAVWYYKVIFAIIVAPFVSLVSNFIKKKEQVDKFDYDINYNPFLYNYKEK